MAGRSIIGITCIACAVAVMGCGATAQTIAPPASRPAPRLIAFGTGIDPERQVRESQDLAKRLDNPA
jgi:hypothetical protein